jgi:FemAB-related protein (PEP-CTERM system-associated)
MTASILLPSSAGLALRVHAEASAAAWDQYLDAHPAASGYHRSAWLGVIATAFGHRVRRLVAESTHGIHGVLPLVLFRSSLFGRFAVSLPFLNEGGVLADSPDVERLLLEAAIQECKSAGAAYLELRHTRRHFSSLPCKRHKVAMTLRLEPSSDRQWQTLDRKIRNQVRKAEKSGLTTTIGGPELLRPFYEVFARNMRDLGTPVYGIRFFEHVVSTFPAHTRVFCVFSGERPIAASIVYSHGNRIEVPWASSLREFNPQAPNMLLYWRMLQFAIEKGVQTFEFGRSTPGEGTYHFKRQWGAEPHELVWEYWTPAGMPLPDLSPRNPGFRRAIALWQHLPVPLTTLIGPAIVRNIP